MRENSKEVHKLGGSYLMFNPKDSKETEIKTSNEQIDTQTIKPVEHTSSRLSLIMQICMYSVLFLSLHKKYQFAFPVASIHFYILLTQRHKLKQSMHFIFMMVKK